MTHPTPINRDKLKLNIEAVILSMNSAPWARQKTTDMVLDLVDSYVAQEVRKARIEEQQLGAGMAATLSNTGFAVWSDERSIRLAHSPDSEEAGHE